LIPVWRPDLAIIDVILPKMSGVDLCIQIKAEFPDCRVALLTGASATSDLLALAPHSFEFLAKPIHPREILALASRLLGPEKGRI
jgi:two-component system response regulator MprA